MHFRLFNKPAAFSIENGFGRMWIDGVYEDYYPAEPYEGFVQIHGSVGLMTLKVVDSNLPPGASVYIDQVLKRVIVKWAKYTPPVQEITEVPNGSFVDSSYWEIIGPGTPATVEQGWSPNGKGNLTFRDMKGEYTVRGAWAPVSSVNRSIKISGKVEHGKSSKGNASCAVGLAWYDADRNLVREDFGNAVTNGGKGRWYDTNLSITPADRTIKFVRPAIKFGRRKQNHPIHAGQITWDHAYVQGYDEDEQLFIEVEVTDSVHNKARHRGVIDENNFWITSQPQGYGLSDGMRSGSEFTYSTGILPPTENFQAGAAFVSAVVNELVKYATYTYNTDAIQARGAEFISASSEVKVKYATYSYNTDAIQASTAQFIGAGSAVVAINRTLPFESFQPGASFINAEITK